MKKYYFLIFLFLSLTLAGYSQKLYIKTLDVTFSGGNNGPFSGNLATDVVCSIDAINGWMNVAVNKVSAPWSVMWWFKGGGCWTKEMVFDQTNRYIEFRVKCDSAQTKPMSVNVWGNCDGCCAEKKTWQGNTFTIPEANVWTIILLKVPPTTGGTQNIVDTVSESYAWSLENGNYSFDYIKFGIAAIPKDTILIQTDDTVYVYESNEKIKFSVTNYIDTTVMCYTCCGTFPDAVEVYETNKWVSEYAHICSHVCEEGYLYPLLPNQVMYDSTNTKQLKAGKFRIKYSFMIRDSIRTYYSNEFSIISNVGLRNNNNNEISIYPNATTGIVNITGDDIIKTEVFDITGRSQGLFYSKQIDLSSLVDGIYILNVYGKEGLIKKEKVILTK